MSICRSCRGPVVDLHAKCMHRPMGSPKLLCVLPDVLCCRHRLTSLMSMCCCAMISSGESSKLRGKAISERASPSCHGAICSTARCCRLLIGGSRCRPRARGVRLSAKDVAVTIVLSAAATSTAAVRVSSRAIINLQDGHVDVSPPSVLFHT
jgi:hypothetical protein